LSNPVFSNCFASFDGKDSGISNPVIEWIVKIIDSAICSTERGENVEFVFRLEKKTSKCNSR
jgi:hypothetical protein